MVKARRERQQRKAANIPLTILLHLFFMTCNFCNLQLPFSLVGIWPPHGSNNYIRWFHYKKNK